MVWQRICRCGTGPVDITDAYGTEEGGHGHRFHVPLFLARSGKISVWQEDLPFGPISLEVKMDWDIGTLEDTRTRLRPVPSRLALRW